MSTPGGRFRVLAAAAAIVVGGALLVGAAEASAHLDGELPPDLQSFAAEFELALDEADREFDKIVLAHAGQLSPKDNCHKQKSAGERHWHVAGSAERGGECVKRDGKTFYMMEVEAVPRAEPKPAFKAPWEACTPQWYELERSIDSFWQHGLGERATALMACLRTAYPQKE